MSDDAPDLSCRLALRPKEAAQALGLSERKLREILPELPHVRVGGAVLIPVSALGLWLEQKARQEANLADAAVQAVLENLAGDERRSR